MDMVRCPTLGRGVVETCNKSAEWIGGGGEV